MWHAAEADVHGCGPGPKESLSAHLGPLVVGRPHRAAAIGRAFRDACAGDAPLGPVIRLAAARLLLSESPAVAAARAKDALALEHAVGLVVDTVLTPWPDAPGNVWDALVGEAGEATSAAELSEGDLASLADVQGWSVEGLMDAGDRVLLPETTDTVALYDSKGDVAEYVSPEEAAHYENIGLESARVADRECLVRDDIDWQQRDAEGWTNLQRAEEGLAPIDRDGEKIELHHVQQREDGLLAELTADEHRGDMDAILHDRVGPSEIDREAFAEVRVDHWKSRAAEVRAEGVA